MRRLISGRSSSIYHHAVICSRRRQHERRETRRLILKDDLARFVQGVVHELNVWGEKEQVWDVSIPGESLAANGVSVDFPGANKDGRHLPSNGPVNSNPRERNSLTASSVVQTAVFTRT